MDEGYEKYVLNPLFAANEVAGKIDNEVIDGAVNGAANVTTSACLSVGYVDNEVVDAGVNAAANVTQASGKQVRRLQTGNIKHYLTFALIGGLVIILLYVVKVLAGPHIVSFFENVMNK